MGGGDFTAPLSSRSMMSRPPPPTHPDQKLCNRRTLLPILSTNDVIKVIFISLFPVFISNEAYKAKTRRRLMMGGRYTSTEGVYYHKLMLLREECKLSFKHTLKGLNFNSLNL